MQHKQVCTVTYLNLDDSPEAAITGWQMGDSPYILNVLTTSPGTAGKAVSVPGNTLIAYDLPAGINKIIGCIEDTQSNTAVVFIQNSLGNHQIARYFNTGMEQLIMSPLLNFSTAHVIHSASIINEMIEWTDNLNEPRKINMAKALTAFKLEEHELFFSPKTPGTTRQLTITATRNGVTIIPLTILIAFSEASTETFNIALADVLNTPTFPAATSPSTYFTFSAENKHVKAISKSPGVFTITIAGNDVDTASGAVTPMLFWDQVVNKYYPLTDNYIATLIRPPLFQRPTATYIQDPTRNTNQVNDTLYQFTTRPRMDDFEIPVFTSYSNVPIIPAGCVGGNFNAILLNFDDPKLQSKEWLSVIRAVDILVRQISEGSDAYGPWKLIDTLFREDFVLDRTYTFYGDGSYTVIDQADQERAYDAIPLQVQTMETILSNTQYRGVLANGVENFNSPALALEIEAEFADTNPVTSNTGYVTFDIYHFCPFSPHSGAYKYSKQYQFIHSLDGGATFVWGGMGVETFGSGFDPKENNVGSNYIQQLAEPGWTVFAQGLPFYATSVQNNPTIPVAGGTINVDIVTGVGAAGNVWNTDRYGNATFQINYTGRQASRQAMLNGLPKSTVTIALPVGTRIVSVAHQWVSSGDKLGKGADKFDRDKGLEWQKQGCPIMMFDGVLGASQATVEVTAGATVTLGDCYIFDWTNPYHAITLQRTKVVYGRLVDKNGEPDSVDNPIQTGTLLERQQAVIVLGDGVPGSPNVVVPTPPAYTSTLFDGTTSDYLDTVLGGLCPTDFNGFFSWATYQDRQVFAAAYGVLGDGSGGPNVINIASSNTTSLTSSGPKWFEFSDEYYKGYLAGGVVSGTGHLALSIGDAQNYIFYNNDKGGVDNMARCSTSIIGKVVSGGVGVPDILVLFENTSRTALTGSTGLFEIQVLGDAVENLNRRGLFREPAGTILYGFRDRLVFNGTQLCDVTWPATNTRLAEITPFWIGQDYSEGHPFEIADVEAFVNIFAVRNIVQRGGTYDIVVNLIDAGGRRATASIPITIRIPEITGNLKAYDPYTYLVDTFGLGECILRWTLLSAVPIPEVGRFHYYQLGISQDTTQLLTFTWAANDIMYVDRFDAGGIVTADKAAANELYIGLDNVFLYADQFTDSRVTYIPLAGDIITLITQPDGTPWTRASGPYEAKVTGGREQGGFTWVTVENLADWPIITPGTVFKVKRFRQQVSEKITFGIGDVMPITNPLSDTPTFSVTSGIITEADTYLRKRQIPYKPTGKPPGNITLIIEDKSMSDFFPSTEWGHGVANFFKPDEVQRRYETRLRTSGSYLPGSNTNGLSTYEPLTFQDHSYVWGAIMRLIIAGESLECLAKNGIVSRYPGKPIVNQSLTGAITVSGENVLGGYHEDKSGFGTMHPESAVAIGNTVYCFDAFRGVLWRSNNNATVAISKLYKADQYFTDKGLDYVTLNLPIWGTFDRFNDMYVIAFPGSDIPPSGRGAIEPDTISFYEKGNRFNAFWSYHPESMGRLGTKMLTALGGKLFIHGNNPIMGEYYGVKYPAIATVVAFQDNLQRKDFLAVEMKAFPLWALPEIRVPADQSHPLGQLSQIDAEDFEQTEGDWNAPFWADANTAVDKPLANGDDLRGNIIIMQAYNNDDGQALLTSISITYTVSTPTQQ